MRRTRPRTALLAAAAAFAIGAAPVAAQDVQYKTVSRMDLGGVVNALASLAGGLEVEETTYIKGAKMREDTKESSLIMDFETGRYTFIDHNAKTYSVVTLEQMLEQMQQSLEQAKAAQGNASQPTVTTGDDRTTVHTDSGDVHLEFELDVDRTNESEKVNGWNARRALITMKTDATVEAEGQEEEEAGSLIVFVDMWASTDVPVHDAHQRLMQHAAASQYMGEAGNAAQSIGAAFASDPQMSAAMQKAGEEMQKIEGTPVKTTTYLIALAPGKELDRELVLNPQRESVAKKAAGGMLRGALGRLGGGRQQQEEQQEEEAPSQKTIMTFISELRDAKAGDLSDSLFEPPAGYRQVDYGSGN
jgi:hypothetical protein